MSEKRKLSPAEITRKVLLVLMLAAVVAVEIWYRLCDSPCESVTELYSSLSRFFGGMVALIFILEFSFGKIIRPLGNKRASALIFIIPALAVAINNFPWVSLDRKSVV